MMVAIGLAGVLLCGCGGSATEQSTSGATAQLSGLAISSAAAQNGALIVTVSAPSGATVYYTIDGSTPTSQSQIYEAPFLITSSLTVKAIVQQGGISSSVATKAFSLNIPSGTLVWSDEFSNFGSAPAQIDASTWSYDTGYQCCGNHEQEFYCAWGSNAAPCNSSSPNVYAGTDGSLHLVTRTASAAVYTSGRVKSQGHLSFLYGRIEARMKLPESQGMWPAFWMLGNSIATVGWPACGELDIMEHIDGSAPPDNAGGPVAGYDWVAGSVHGGPSASSEINGSQRYHGTNFSAADWHVYGMIWKKGEVGFYVDDPANVYATYKATDAQWTNNSWPFDSGPEFVLLNLAVGGDWPGNVDSTTVFPSEALVDYVRVYTN